ncbi:hypothetical protein [Streptomyces sp. NPDC060194]|uniref:hypothetical protein n=1 Tax=Streptomyces sp. NPDC060194 TaxID=3347069 RepID=UPI003655EE3E
MSVTIDKAFAAERTRRRRAALRLAASAAALAPAAALGAWCARDGGLLWGARLLHHPYLFALAAVVLLGTAFFLATGLRRTGIVAALAGVPLLLFALGLGMLFGPLFPDTTTHPAPGGADRRVTVVEGVHAIDTTWTVYVDEGTFPTTRRWSLGTFAYGVSVSWSGPHRLDVVGGGESHSIDLDPATGRPARTLSVG